MDVDSFRIRFPLTFSAKWKVVRTGDDSPWRIYRSKVSSIPMLLFAFRCECSLKISRSQHSLLVLPKRSLASFLNDIPDSVPLSALTLPGTHDTYVALIISVMFDFVAEASI